MKYVKRFAALGLLPLLPSLYAACGMMGGGPSPVRSILIDQADIIVLAVRSI